MRLLTSRSDTFHPTTEPSRKKYKCLGSLVTSSLGSVMEQIRGSKGSYIRQLRQLKFYRKLIQIYYAVNDCFKTRSSSPAPSSEPLYRHVGSYMFVLDNAADSCSRRNSSAVENADTHQNCGHVSYQLKVTKCKPQYRVGECKVRNRLDLLVCQPNPGLRDLALRVKTDCKCRACQPLDTNKTVNNSRHVADPHLQR
ncbi:hypothetical protein AGLY_000282 [Aphis glycines]|uniref:Uncharacterized protein n=1 Tax=Aphis glycines TaxID=307491 RepID=A0A6G0U7I8_APHGL|nr:hypothetical protein AGLY_000282 [Aphis glycines]